MSDSHASALAHHFTDMDQQIEANTLGMWIFLVTEVMFFGGYSGLHHLSRAYYQEFAEASHHLILPGHHIYHCAASSSLTMACRAECSVGSTQSCRHLFVMDLLLGRTF